jgi:rod shape-determining protein MreC
LKNRQLAAGLLITALLILGLDRVGILNGPRLALGGALIPIQIGWNRLGQSLIEKLTIVTEIGNLSSDNLKLRDENDHLKADLAQVGILKKENESLKAQLKTPQTASLRLVAADTLGFIPAAGTRQLLLSIGEAQGVKVGQAVVSGSSVLGKIATVRSDRSTLRLLTDPQAKILVRTSHDAKGILVGQFQSATKLTKVLQEESLNTGDLVLTSGEEDWPTNLVIGQIIKVIKRDNELFQEADVAPLLNYGRLQTVFVVVG